MKKLLVPVRPMASSLPFRLLKDCFVRLLFAGGWFIPASLPAATVYWDINGTGTGATSSVVGDASGTWNNSNAFFNSDSAGAPTAPGTYTDNSDVVFSAGTNATGSSTITVAGLGANAVGIASLTIKDGTVTFNSSGTAVGRLVARGTNTITLGANAGGSAAFNTIITLGNNFFDQTWTNQNTTAGRNLTFNQAIRIGGSSTFNLTLANTSAGGTAVNGALGVRDSAGVSSTLNLIVHNTGSGVTTLSGGNVYTGTTTVSAGALVIDSDAISTNLANQTYSRNASTFTLAGFSNGDRVVFNEGTAPSGLTAGTVYYVVNTSGSTFQLSNTLGGSAITLTGTQSSITNAISKAGALGSTSSAVQLGDANTGSNPVSLLVNGAHTVQRAIAVNNYGTGTTLGGNSDHNSFFTGNIVLSKTANLQSVTTGANSVTFQTGVISGTGGVNKTGSGTVTLGGVNTFTGVTTFSQGILSVGTIGNGGTAGNLGQATNAAANLVFNGGTLRYTGLTASSDRAFTINTGITATIEVTANNLGIAGATGAATNGALTKIGAGTLTLTGANTYTGGTSVNAGTLALSGSGRLADTGNVAVNGGTLDLGGISDTVGAVTISSGTISNGTLTGTSYSATNSGTVSAVLAGSGSFTKTGAGTVTFTAANTYEGTTLVNGGTLILSGSGSIANSTVVDVQSGAALNTSAVTGGTYTYGSGQTVQGNGTITGNSVIQGTLAAGNSPGILTFNDNLTLDGSNSLFEIQNTGLGRGTDYDGVNVGGILTYDGTLTLTMTTLVANATYNLFDFVSFDGNFDGIVFSGGAYARAFSYDAGSQSWKAMDTAGNQQFTFALASGDLIVAAIPEPSASLLFAGGLMAVLFLRRRRAR